MIDEIISKKLTGNLNIMCANNKSAQVSFNNGEIVGLRFGAFMGDKAIDNLLSSEFISLRFIEGQHLLKTNVSAQANDILDRLRSISTEEVVVSKSATQTKSSTQGLSSLDFDRFSVEIKSVLTDYLGPVAAFVFDDSKQNIPTDGQLSRDQLSRFVIYLASNIKDQADSKNFLDTANSLIDKHSKK